MALELSASSSSSRTTPGNLSLWFSPPRPVCSYVAMILFFSVIFFLIGRVDASQIEPDNTYWTCFQLAWQSLTTGPPIVGDPLACLLLNEPSSPAVGYGTASPNGKVLECLSTPIIVWQCDGVPTFATSTPTALPVTVPLVGEWPCGVHGCSVFGIHPRVPCMCT